MDSHCQSCGANQVLICDTGTLQCEPPPNHFLPLYSIWLQLCLPLKLRKCFVDIIDIVTSNETDFQFWVNCPFKDMNAWETYIILLFMVLRQPKMHPSTPWVITSLRMKTKLYFHLKILENIFEK